MTVFVGHARTGVLVAAAVLLAACGNGRSAAQPTATTAAPTSVTPVAPAGNSPPLAPHNPTAGNAAPVAAPSGSGAAGGEIGAATCAAAQLKAKTATNKGTYRVGEEVTITGTVINTGAEPCAIALADFIAVTDASGGVAYQGSFRSFTRDELAPGQSRTTTFTWEQQLCGPGRPGCQEDAIPGHYTASMRWSANTAISASASFAIASERP